MPACVAGSGTDYQVGPGPGQLASIEAVPWESLQAGDTVRIFHQATPYRSKFLVAGQGTAERPIRVCGVPGPNGERPVIDGENAVTRPDLPYSTSDAPTGGLLHQTRSIIVIKPLAQAPDRAFPSHIQIDGLELRGAHANNTFTDNRGIRRQYVDFGACIWIERGHNITIANNAIHDCTNGIFSKSATDAWEAGDPSEYSVTKDIRIAGNDIYGNGIYTGKDGRGIALTHGVYLESHHVVYEFNRFGPMAPSAGGSAIKDRGAGTVVRYNRIEDVPAKSIDLVEAEDYAPAATSLPEYRVAHVYGNQIFRLAPGGLPIHYGGDHMGSEPDYRKGTLWFYHNTIVYGGNRPYRFMFQLATIEERGEIWNNVLLFKDNYEYGALRDGQDVDPPAITGGIFNLGPNWINPGWKLDQTWAWSPLTGPVYGQENLISSEAAPIDPVTLVPLAGSSIIGAGAALPAATAAHPVQYQLDANGRPQPRNRSGAGADLGAVQR